MEWNGCKFELKTTKGTQGAMFYHSANIRFLRKSTGRYVNAYVLFHKWLLSCCTLFITHPKEAQTVARCHVQFFAR